MKMKKITTKNKLGFSLLELMVVVAIIGVLATFAIPRFNIFRARARQGEAKSNLGVIFTLQEAFKIDKEQYYDGTTAVWGGEPMNNGDSSSDNYVGYKDAGAGNVCKANKLGFRLANCSAARYRYYMVSADEFSFMTYAFAPSDTSSRIFPGCNGSTRENTAGPSTSKSGKKKCQTINAAGAAVAVTTAADGTGGDAFCLDQSRTVDNFVDIVGSPTCVN